MKRANRKVERSFSKRQVLRAKQPTIWDVANRLLYDFCAKNPGHSDESTIVAKVWLIGRAYAAAIERGAKKTGDELYEKHVGPDLKKSRIDDWLGSIRSIRKPTADNVMRLIDVYSNVENHFARIAGKGRLSLVAKYLHFHLPQLFFLYDSRALKSIRKNTAPVGVNLPAGFDFRAHNAEYCRFFLRCLALADTIRERYGIELNPRQLDNLLIHS